MREDCAEAGHETTDAGGSQSSATASSSSPIPHPPSLKRGRIAARLKRLGKYLALGLVTQDEYAAARQRILAEI